MRRKAKVEKSVKNSKDLVSSIIEITAPTSPAVKETRSLSLHQYHMDVKEMGKKITSYAIGLSKENLLSVKMALMNAVRDVEEKIKENREEK